MDGDQEFVTELAEHVNLCDRMAQFHFVEDGNETTDTYTATFMSTSEFLVVEEQSEVTIQPKVSSATQDKNYSKVAISPSFEGVAVKDVVVVDNDDGSRTVRFCPIHTGELTFVACINGSRIHDCHITKTVKKSDTLPECCRIGDSIFESGTHTWEIEIDHSDCQVDLTAGVIDCMNSKASTFSGYVKANSQETITFTLDMEEKKLKINPSWSWYIETLDVMSHRRVFPYFSSDCEECKLTVTNSDDWHFVQYKRV